MIAETTFVALRHDIEAAAALGKQFATIDACERALAIQPADAWVLQQLCLALCRCRLWQRARQIYESRLLPQIHSLPQHMRSEIQALRARLIKDSTLGVSGEKRAAALAEAAENYVQVWQDSKPEDRSYPAINAATLYLLAGQTSAALTWAKQTLLDVYGDDYWHQATRAEASLILGRVPESLTYARLALDAAHGRMDYLASTVRNLRLMIPVLPEAAGVAAVLTPPPVRWGGGWADVTPSLPTGLRSAILAVTGPADLEFALKLAENGVALDLILPRDRAVALSLRPAGKSAEQVQQLFSSANILEGYGAGPITAADVQQCMGMARGLALLRAHAFSTTSLPIGGDDVGVTGSRQTSDVRWVSALFGDFKGFSRLDDEAVIRFTSVVLGVVAATIKPWQPDILTVNTWGDGIYIVIGDTAAAADCALALCHAIRSLDFSAHNLPNTLGLRLGVHHTCATLVHDPLTGHLTMVGRGISTAASIEPITPVGAVYATEVFAAALAAHPESEKFACAYVGRVPLAKKFGDMRMFELSGRQQ